MQIVSVRECQRPECAQMPPHEDDEGTRVLGVPAWLISFAVIVGAAVAMLAYTAAERL